MNRRELLKLAPCVPLALLLRPRVYASPRRVRRSKPCIEGLERSGLCREDIWRVEGRTYDK